MNKSKLKQICLFGMGLIYTFYIFMDWFSIDIMVMSIMWGFITVDIGVDFLWDKLIKPKIKVLQCVDVPSEASVRPRSNG